MTNTLKKLQQGDIVAMNADYVRAVTSATIRADLRKSRGEVLDVDGGMALVLWKGAEEGRWTNLACLALYYRPANRRIADEALEDFNYVGSRHHY